MSKTRRTFAFLVLTSLTSLTALSIIAVADAQVRKPAPAAAPAKKPAAKPGGRPLTPDSEDGGAPAALAGRDERAPAAAARDAGVGGGAVESKTLDGGTRVFRFGEVEVEGRLKSPQIVYFLRRVRAEFAAGDLGHRSFVRELSETRNEPGF